MCWFGALFLSVRGHVALARVKALHIILSSKVQSLIHFCIHESFPKVLILMPGSYFFHCAMHGGRSARFI